MIITNHQKEEYIEAIVRRLLWWVIADLPNLPDNMRDQCRGVMTIKGCIAAATRAVEACGAAREAAEDASYKAYLANRAASEALLTKKLALVWDDDPCENAEKVQAAQDDSWEFIRDTVKLAVPDSLWPNIVRDAERAADIPDGVDPFAAPNTEHQK